MLESKRFQFTARLVSSIALAGSIAVLPNAAQAQVVYETSPPPPAQPAPVAAPERTPIYEGPRIMKYEDGDPIPRGYYVVEQPQTGLIVGGSVLFGSLYLISLLTAAGNTDATPHGQTSPTDALYIPVIGPFVQMTRSSNTAVGNVFLAIDGVGQTAGMLMLIAGITTTRTVLARGAATDSTRAPASPKWAATPLVGPGIAGMGMVGTF